MSRGVVSVAALKLVDPDSHVVLSRERWLYAVELSKLLKDLGYDVIWWQVGKGWRAEVIPGVPLIGSLKDGQQLLFAPQASDDFREQAGFADWSIYFDLTLAYPQVLERSLAISHSVYWDDPLFEARLNTDMERDEWKRRLWIALQGPQKVVATDTGLIQWATTTWPGLYHRFAYIPDFVPETAGEAVSTQAPQVQSPVQPVPADDGSDRPVRVLFASPLLPAQGISETIRVIEKLLALHPRLEFVISGSGTKAVNDHMAAWASQHPRTSFDPRPLTAGVLQEVDIVLFPAKWGQGTSMLCLQAMAAGKAVIVGQTGGLTDLVLHGHNGLVVQPTVPALFAALSDLLTDRALREELGHNARQVAQSFSLELWRKRWTRVLTDTFAGGGGQ